MNLSGKMLGKRLVWGLSSAAIFAAGATLLYPATRNKSARPRQEKEAARAVGDQSTSLNDQTDLNVTVYNSNIALIRDVGECLLDRWPRGCHSSNNGCRCALEIAFFAAKGRSRRDSPHGRAACHHLECAGHEIFCDQRRRLDLATCRSSMT